MVRVFIVLIILHFKEAQKKDTWIKKKRDITLAYKLAASKGLSVYRCLLKSPAQLELKPIPVSAAILEQEVGDFVNHCFRPLNPSVMIF